MPTTPALHVRPLAPGDTATVESIFAGLSPDSRYLRFHGAVCRLPTAWLRVLTDVDGRNHVALVADRARRTGSPEPVGLARFIRTGPNEAEIAIEVVDAEQSAGVGRRLLTDLLDRAAGSGVRAVTASVLPHNRKALRLLRGVLPGAAAMLTDGVVEIRADVPRNSSAHLARAAGGELQRVHGLRRLVG